MNNRRRLVFTALISAGVLWGTTVPLSKLALAWLPPAWLAVTRFGLAAALLLFVRRSRLRGAASPAILVSGALGYGGSVVLQNFGIERTSVTHAALLIGATPVLVAVIAAVCGHGVARPAAWAGFGVSLAGVAVIAAGRGGGATMGGDGLVLAGQLASAGFTVAQARLLRGRDPVAVTGLQLMAAAVVTLPLALLTGRAAAGPASPSAVVATGALILIGTVAPTTLFAVAQSRVSADVAGAFLNLEPLVGAAAGTVLFANPLGAVQVAGGAAILAGISLSSLSAIRSSRALESATRRGEGTEAAWAPANAARPVSGAIPDVDTAPAAYMPAGPGSAGTAGPWPRPRVRRSGHAHSGRRADRTGLTGRTRRTERAALFGHDRRRPADGRRTELPRRPRPASRTRSRRSATDLGTYPQRGRGPRQLRRPRSISRTTRLGRARRAWPYPQAEPRF